MKTETWLGHKIRFVEKDGEWWAVAVDVANALDYSHTPHMMRILNEGDKDVHIMDTLGGVQELSIISEFGIYDVVFNSRKKEAKEFKRWVFETIKFLRQSIRLEGFQVFRMMDKEHQKEAMAVLKSSLSKPTRKDFIKANTIANKAISTMHGYPKMINKDAMSPDMLVKRQQILEDTVSLMGAVDRFGLDLPIAKTVYQKYSQ